MSSLHGLAKKKRHAPSSRSSAPQLAAMRFYAWGRQIFEFIGLIREQATRSRRLRLSLVPRCAHEWFRRASRRWLC
jgi:hypothetical protein